MSAAPVVFLLQVDPVGACRHCLSALGQDGQLLCNDRHVRGPGAPVACTQARGQHGGCGPEALRLHWPAIGVYPDTAAPLPRAA